MPAELPDGWTWAYLGDVAEVNPKRERPRGDGPTLFVAMSSVDEVTGTIVSPRATKVSEIPSGATFFSKGDVIMAKITPSMENGKAALVDLTSAFGSTEFHVLRPGVGLSAEYLWRFIRQASFRRRAAREMSGAVGQQRISADFLRAQQIPLPPLSKQLQIVARLSQLLGNVRSASDGLRTVGTTATLLHTEILRDTFALGDAVPLGTLIRSITAGKNVRCEERPPRAGERGLVKVSCVSRGYFDPAEAKTLPTDVVPSETTKIQKGDLLFSRANTLELVGSIAVVEHLANDNLYLSDKILRLECSPEVRSWIAWYLRSPEGRRQLQDASSGNQESMRNISQSGLLSVMIPMPPRDVRERSLKIVSDKLTVVDTTAAVAKRSLVDLAEVEEGLVALAFRGELKGGGGGSASSSSYDYSELDSTPAFHHMSIARVDVRVQQADLRELVARYGDSSDTRLIWRSSGLSIEVFYKTLRREIKAGHLKVDDQGRIAVT